jgi:hypothetical protein
MHRPVAARVSCLALAALVTTALLGSITHIAAAQNAAVQLAQSNGLALSVACAADG